MTSLIRDANPVETSRGLMVNQASSRGFREEAVFMPWCFVHDETGE